MFQQRLRAISTAKYLGMVIDNKVNFNCHTANVKKTIIRRAKHFSKLTYKAQGINGTTATKIYKLLCRPIIEYGHPLYLNCKGPAINNLKVAETTALSIQFYLQLVLTITFPIKFYNFVITFFYSYVSKNLLTHCLLYQ